MTPDSPAESSTSKGSSARQRIVAGARAHFFAHGFRHVTMDDLADELGMSKKTLYAHFSSKRALLEAVLLNKFQEVNADLERAGASEAADFLVSLQGLLACLQKQMEEIQPPFVRDMRREEPQMFQLIESRRKEAIERHFGRFLSAGRKAGLVRKDIPLSLIIEILLGAVQAIVNPQKTAELGITPREAFIAVIKVVLEGSLTGKGRTNL